mmetsp:Transcript_12547/g.30542  ORF Transcript_12547/g.30542 Transcript_12547/m.30542 type:complete len:203 (-) Transcript_12547:2455-3063(-)
MPRWVLVAISSIFLLFSQSFTVVQMLSWSSSSRLHSVQCSQLEGIWYGYRFRSITNLLDVLRDGAQPVAEPVSVPELAFCECDWVWCRCVLVLEVFCSFRETSDRVVLEPGREEEDLAPAEEDETDRGSVVAATTFLFDCDDEASEDDRPDADARPRLHDLPPRSPHPLSSSSRLSSSLSLSLLRRAPSLSSFSSPSPPSDW